MERGQARESPGTAMLMRWSTKKTKDIAGELNVTTKTVSN
jgi:hypothetical protein